MNRYLLPLGIFGLLVVFMVIGLNRDPHDIPSPLIGKAAPAFALPVLGTPGATVSTQQLRGQVWLLNVWASWCTTCREEHPLLVEMARQNLVPLYGLDYKDEPEDAQQLLAKHGNPYTAVIMDRDGQVGRNYGVYGVPETYLIDRQGVIRYKQTGALTPEVLQNKLLPLIRELQKS